jgi:hypothetical protein
MRGVCNSLVKNDKVIFVLCLAFAAVGIVYYVGIYMFNSAIRNLGRINEKMVVILLDWLVPVVSFLIILGTLLANLKEHSQWLWAIPIVNIFSGFVYLPLLLSIYNRYNETTVSSACFQQNRNHGQATSNDESCRVLYWSFALALGGCICLVLIHFSMAIRTFVRAKRLREMEDRAIESMLDTDTAFDDDLLEDA